MSWDPRPLVLSLLTLVGGFGLGARFEQIRLQPEKTPTELIMEKIDEPYHATTAANVRDLKVYVFAVHGCDGRTILRVRPDGLAEYPTGEKPAEVWGRFFELKCASDGAPFDADAGCRGSAP